MKIVSVYNIKNKIIGLRYRIKSVKDLHLKFITDTDVDCSYSYFAKLVPENIIKPKPTDWGTCLCKVCLNPELKLESIKKTLPNINLT